VDKGLLAETYKPHVFSMMPKSKQFPSVMDSILYGAVHRQLLVCSVWTRVMQIFFQDEAD
jgi:hypothetical protein